MNTKANSALAQAVVTRDADHGAKLSARISPCAWIYPSYPFQITVTMASGGETIISDKALTFDTATEADISRLLATVAVKKCKCRGCNNPVFAPTTVVPNREGRCESCFMAKLKAALEKSQQKQTVALAKKDARYKAQGYTHRVDAVVHADGDDEFISYWMVNATDEKVIAELKKRRSVVLNDYKITVL